MTKRYANDRDAIRGDSEQRAAMGDNDVKKRAMNGMKVCVGDYYNFRFATEERERTLMQFKQSCERRKRNCFFFSLVQQTNLKKKKK